MIQLSQSNRPFVAVPGSKDKAVSADTSITFLRGQEEERSRVARELHDDVSQNMALLAIELERLGEMLPPNQDVLKQFSILQKRVSEISSDIYGLCHKLHSSKLEHLGIAAAMKGLCRDHEAVGKLKIAFHHEGDLSRLPKEIKLCIFRITQEALRNCSRHSGAEIARVVLIKNKDEVSLSITDDGQGFDVESGLIRGGLGFTSMHERARMIGGHIAIRSKEGHGTCVEVSIPLKRESASELSYGTVLNWRSRSVS
jgi:signal transduction histidine kinase